MTSILSGVFRFIKEIFCASPSQNEKLQLPQVIITAPSPQHERPHPQPQSHPQPHPRPHPQSPAHQPHKPHINDNLVNQDNEHYKQLRVQARQEGDEMARAFEQAHTAYESGDGAHAKQLSNKGIEHKQKMNQLNAQASEWIYQGADSGPTEIDLHGLFVKEAVTYTEKAIQSAQARGDPEIRLIVGKGLHSSDHVAKVKPAIEDLMQRYNLAAHLDERNAGVLIVTLNGETIPHDRKLGSEDIIRRIERNDRDCIVM